MSKMTIKEAIDYLQPIADNSDIAKHGIALRVALDAMHEAEKFNAILAEYKDRCNRQSSEIVRNWETIRKLEAELERYKNMEDHNGND